MTGECEVRKGKGNPVPALACIKGAARFNVPIRQTNRYQQYKNAFTKMYCDGILDLNQVDFEVETSD